MISGRGEWGEWESWGACSKSCSVGQRFRSRDCNGGIVGEPNCVPTSASIETEACNIHPCLESKIFLYSFFFLYSS